MPIRDCPRVEIGFKGNFSDLNVERGQVCSTSFHVFHGLMNTPKGCVKGNLNSDVNIFCNLNL